MINLSFFDMLWISFSVLFFSSFFVFFARNLKVFLMGGTLFLLGISFQFLAVDIFRGSWNGQIISVALWLMFLLQAFVFKWCLITEAKMTPVFFILPFLAFVTMTVSLDLLTFLLGLFLFSLSFLLLATLKGKNKNILSAAIRKMSISFLCYAYGMSILFSREGTILSKELYLKLSKGNWDDWTALGVGLLFLSIVIDLYAIIPLISSKNEKV